MPDSTDTPDPFPFLQEDIYNETQPGMGMKDQGFLNPVQEWGGGNEGMNLTDTGMRKGNESNTGMRE